MRAVGKLEPDAGIEPATPELQKRCSANELIRLKLDTVPRPLASGRSTIRTVKHGYLAIKASSLEPALCCFVRGVTHLSKRWESLAGDQPSGVKT